MNNFFDTGDDAINFASGLGSLSKFNRSVSDVRIINNFVRRSHGGIIAAGSHTGAWIENILAEDNVSNHSDTPFRFKSNPVNGGGVRNVVIRDSAAAKPNTQAFIFTTQYSDENQILQFESAPSVAEFYGITVDNVTVEGENKASVGAIDVKGKLSDGHRDIKFTNVKFKNFAKGANISGLSNSEFNNVTFEGNKLPLEKQWNIQDSRNLKFEGSTVENASIKDAKEIPAFDESAKITAKEEEKSVTLTWDKAIDNTAVSNYVIKTYVNDNLVHESTVEGNTTTYTEEGLLPGTIYKFTVEGKDEAGNVTEKKLVIIAKTVDGVVEAIKVPTDKIVSIVGESGYTWTNISWNACDDATVRKYEIYANGIKVNEVLNPTLRNLIKDGKISTNVSGLNQGSDNTITVKAVNDRGDVFEYAPVVARTWDHFDRFAPSFSSDAKLNVEVKGDTVELSWSEATDDSGILGYRVYMNGICLGEGKFNQANKNYTTTETSYEIKGLKAGKYTFKVEAEDTWWRSASTTKGIAAPTNWSGTGPSAVAEILGEIPNNNTDINKDNNSGNSGAIVYVEPEEIVNDNIDENTKDNSSNASVSQGSSKTGDYSMSTVFILTTLVTVALGFIVYSKKRNYESN